MKKILTAGFSFLISSLLLYYLWTHSQWNDWQKIVFQINFGSLFFYLLLYAIGLLLRTFRYQLLLKSAQSTVIPLFRDLILVTSVRNMLADFLPARTGSLSYIVILNKAYKVDLSSCLTSFTYAFLFDLLAMAPILASTILAESWTSYKNYFWLWVVAVVIMAVALILILSLSHLIKIFSEWSSRNDHQWRKYPWLRQLDHQLHDFNQSLFVFKKAKIFWPTLGLSVLIRAIKYLSLYILLSAVLQALSGHWTPLPFWVVLLGLAASEASAGLPISGIAGFGFYEGVLGAVLATQGIDSSQAVLVSFAMHFLTQVVDYSLGGGALLYILTKAMRK
jgi:uncharacterized membrane protein YbhN (UPF0104 family)